MRSPIPVQFEALRLRGFEEDASSPVRVTLLCADVVGFSEMSERLGDRALLRVMRQVAGTIRAEVAAHGGELIEIRGDAFLMAFPDPLAALACALRIERSLRLEPERYHAESVRVRMAVHSGRVLRDGGSYFGRNVIVPYRLLERIDAGWIALTEPAARVLPAAVRAGLGRAHGFRPKGLRKEVRYVAIHAAEPSIGVCLQSGWSRFCAA